MMLFAVVSAVACAGTPLSATSQQASISLGTAEAVTVTAIEKPGKLPRLRVRAAEKTLELKFGSTDPATFKFRSMLRFKRIEVPSLPTPLLFVAAAAASGSNTVFEVAMVGAHGGEPRVLNPRPWTTTLEGGLHIGPLGADRGTGVAIWNITWKPGDSRVGPHPYEIRFYPWQGDRFVPGPTLVTKGPVENWDAAARELDLTEIKNALLEFSDFDAYR